MKKQKTYKLSTLINYFNTTKENNTNPIWNNYYIKTHYNTYLHINNINKNQLLTIPQFITLISTPSSNLYFTYNHKKYNTIQIYKRNYCTIY